MRTATVYIADDGAEFKSESKALAHNALLAEIAEAMAPLGPEVKDRAGRFANGGGYRQHSPEDVLAAKRGLVEIARRVVPDDIWKHPAEEIHPHSFAGRLLDESNSTLYSAWHRFMCIDSRSREWGQPYYALNPDKGTQKEWR